MLRPKISRNRVVNSVEEVMEREEENFFSTIYSRYESHCPLVADRMWEANVKAKHTRRNPPHLASPSPRLIRFCLHSDFRRSFLTFRSSPPLSSPSIVPRQQPEPAENNSSPRTKGGGGGGFVPAGPLPRVSTKNS